MSLRKRSNDLLPLNYQKLLFLSYFILPLVFVDQVSKLIVQKYFLYVCNGLGAFGLSTGGISVYLGVLLLISYSMFIEKKRYILIGLSFVFAGGFSNIIDRLLLGCVRDFIKILMFPTFNVADAAITFGVILIIFGMFKNKNDRYSF